ncbi:MAG: adenine deaminase C-terminal domain-containing protein [Spirochaetota bacterium]
MFPHNENNGNLVEASLGNKPADIVIKNGVLMDVYTRRMLPGRSVAVYGKWISYVGPDAGYAVGKDTRVIDAGGRVICPGFVDGHTHITSFYSIPDLLKYAIPGGTTTYITEVDSYGFALGAKGFKMFLEQIRNRPVKFFCTVPAMVSTSKSSGHFAVTPEEIKNLLKMEDVLGLGESYWQNIILTPDKRVFALMRETIKAGKAVEGHAAGAADKRLAAYACAGAVSCHEAVSAEDVLNRLEMGFYAILRQGYIRDDIGSLKSLIGKIDLRRCILCTDGVDAEYLLKFGYFNNVIQNAITMGISPIDAICMSTINPAEHYHMDHLIGGIAPGRYADILILPGPDVIKPDFVISNGSIIFENGAVNAELKHLPYKKAMLNTVNVPLTSPKDFSVSASKCSNPGSVRTMDVQSNGLVVKEGSANVSASDGKIFADPQNDLLKVVFIDRATGKAKKFTGFIRGIGIKSGAIATTHSWDASSIVAVGAGDEDIALAVNTVIGHQGGSVLASGGKVLVDIPFPVGGYIPEKPIEEVQAGMIAFQKKAEELGSKLRSVHLTLSALSSAAIPFMRITEKGYFRFRENDYVGI